MNIFLTTQKPCAFAKLSNKRKRREPKPPRKHPLGQQIRWVRQYNEAMARACPNQGWKKGGFGVVRNRRSFRRHWIKAWHLKEKRNLTTIMLDDLPPANIPHWEPDYDSNKVRK